MKEIYEQIKQEGIDISKIVQKKATKLKINWLQTLHHIKDKKC